MNNASSLNHSRWECKYHVVWIPKYRRKTLYGQLRRYLGRIFKELARSRECEVLEGHLLSDHVHMLISILPKYSVAQVIGFIKGKSAIHIARNYLGHRRNFTGQHFWAREYRRVTTLLTPAAVDVHDAAVPVNAWPHGFILEASGTDGTSIEMLKSGPSQGPLTRTEKSPRLKKEFAC